MFQSIKDPRWTDWVYAATLVNASILAQAERQGRLQHLSRWSHPFPETVFGVGFFACGGCCRLQNPLYIPRLGKARSSAMSFADVLPLMGVGLNPRVMWFAAASAL